jgi:hypothetical protein
MFSIPVLSEKIRALRDRHLTADEFGDWFLSASWGHYDLRGGKIAHAIEAVGYVLGRFESDDFQEDALPKELADAVRPFEANSTIRIVPIRSDIAVPVDDSEDMACGLPLSDDLIVVRNGKPMNTASAMPSRPLALGVA